MVAAAGAALVALVLALAGASVSPPTLAGCALFPADNAWNQRVDTLPVAGGSDATIASIGLGTGLHADFGSGTWQGKPIGIPYTLVPGTQQKLAVKFDYVDESDAGPYPIPKNVKIEGGSDHHALIVDTAACRLYELFDLRGKKKKWRAGSGAIWNLSSNALRPEGWTSADAAGLPILAGLARYDEVATGAIEHALRFTVVRSRGAYIYPARHYASSLTEPALPPMGLRVRLKASFDTSGFPPQARAVLEALKRYGMMVADNGSNWFISGVPDSRWNNDDLRTLRNVTGSNFEVVDTSTLRPRS
jgi:hypothetical protein